LYPDVFWAAGLVPLSSLAADFAALVLRCFACRTPRMPTSCTIHVSVAASNSIAAELHWSGPTACATQRLINVALVFLSIVALKVLQQTAVNSSIPLALQVQQVLVHVFNYLGLS
jgi:hypothetical protein